MQKLGKDQKKEKVSWSDNKPTRKSEATMTFFLTNLSLLALQLGGVAAGPLPPLATPM